MAVKIQGNKIHLTRGDTLRVTVGITQDGEAYAPVEGDSVRFALKRDLDDPNPLILRDIPIDTLQLILVPEDTKPLDFGKYWYDVELTKADGTVDTFIGPERFYITEEVH